MRYRKNISKLVGGLLCLLAVMAAAFTVSPVEAAKKVKIESIEYEGDGEVEVEFRNNVKWKKKASVKVTDPKGKSVKVKILEKDSDEISFRLKKYSTAGKYTFKISGVRRKGSSKYETVKGTFKISGKSKIVVEEVDYDEDDREVEFEFKYDVRWKNPKVTILDADGKNLVKKIVDKDDDSIEVKVEALTEGETYTYKIEGVRRAGAAAYKTVTGSFIAGDEN